MKIVRQNLICHLLLTASLGLAGCASNIPVEIPIECHRKCYAVPVSQNRVFQRLYPRGRALLATDNPTSYGSTLTDGYVAVAEAYALTTKELEEITKASIDASFADDITKEALRKRLEMRVASLRSPPPSV